MKPRHIPVMLSCLLALPMVQDAWPQGYLEQQRKSTLRDTRGKLAIAEQELADLKNRQARWNAARNRGDFAYHMFDCRSDPINVCLSRCRTYIESSRDPVMCASQAGPPYGPRVLVFAPRGSLPNLNQLPPDQQQRLRRGLEPSGEAMTQMQARIDKTQSDIDYYRSVLGEQRARSRPPLPAVDTGSVKLLGQ